MKLNRHEKCSADLREWRFYVVQVKRVGKDELGRESPAQPLPGLGGAVTIFLIRDQELRPLVPRCYFLGLSHSHTGSATRPPMMPAR